MKQINLKAVSLICLLASTQLHAQTSVKLTSPDGNIGFTFRLAETPVYSVAYKKKVLIADSPLTLEFDDGPFGKNLALGKTVSRTGDETYDLIVGKAKKVHSHYREITLPLKERKAPFREVRLTVRAFDDGLAFRYEFPEQAGKPSFVLYDESTTFNLSGNPLGLVMYLPNYRTSHEDFYYRERFDKMKLDKLIEMPAMFEFTEQKAYMAVTEASVLNYAGMYLSKEEGLLCGKLSPNLDNPQVKVKAALPHKSPWRVMIISDRVGAIIESNILTNLAEPCKIEDLSWIKPGKTSWMWWNGGKVTDYIPAPGNNFQTNKYYIDFCAANKIQYHAVSDYADKAWYTDDGTTGDPGPNYDITKPVKTLDMKKICDYAQSKGVNIMVWVHWKVLHGKIDEAFALFEQWGVKGMMIDYMDRDDQEMILMQEEFLAKAAKHHLFVQFHGASKPSGLHRTYPNEFTREGTKNYECHKWQADINADHDINIPFTRLLAGATDYHLGGFRAVTQQELKAKWTLPFVTSTRCHMLAMYVVLESYLHMVADYPEAYKGQQGFDWIQTIPTVWDETRVPDARTGEYIIVARKKDNEWWAGTINNSTARNVKMSLDFLDDGDYQVEMYVDAPDSETNLNHLVKQTKTLTKKDVLELSLAASGGAVMHFKKI
ncbi:MAG: glycoside hydrolase family 97 protein [Bacteroidales bacterium]|jgi:alpha-glucosidase|nr:glycoside hydrolase family 97 protein [Bacteroidales bacterium]